MKDRQTDEHVLLGGFGKQILWIFFENTQVFLDYVWIYLNMLEYFLNGRIRALLDALLDVTYMSKINI
jgi:hypothetical protein